MDKALFGQLVNYSAAKGGGLLNSLISGVATT